MAHLIAVLPGDGIGPEVTAQAVRVLEALAEKHQIPLRLEEALIGGAGLDGADDPLPPDTRSVCEEAGAVLLGAVGGPKWDGVAREKRPEQGLLRLRKQLGVFANLRPIAPYPQLADASPLKPERLAGVDMLVVRELTGGIYFGHKEQTATRAVDHCEYSVAEIERVFRMAGRLAGERRGRITSVDKANVLATSRLWRETVTRLHLSEFPDLTLEHLLVDAAAMHLLSRPSDFDVIVTENMFGDILTDEASMLAGSLGLLPSASLGDGGRGLYEPIHGSAPDIAGQGIANPVGSLLSVALLLRHSLNETQAAEELEGAVQAVIASGLRTADLAPSHGAVSTAAFGDAVLGKIGA
jgi:3-isopropylmalate dehydrogenase